MAKNKFPKTVRLKTYLLSLMLVSVIFLATVAYVASNGGFTAPNLYLDSLPSTVSYVISTDGTYYWSTRYDGKITDYSTNASAVINNAIGNLTSGRTWVEWVVLKGNFSIISTILVPSYVGLDMRQARLNLGAVVNMFQNSGYGSTTSNHVMFLGGFLWGNKATINGGSGIAGCFNGVFIDSMFVQSFKQYGIWLQSYSGTYSSGGFNIHDCVIGGGSSGQGNAAGGLLVDNNGHGTDDAFVSNTFFINNNVFNAMLNSSYNIKFNLCHFVGAGQGTPRIQELVFIGDCRENLIEQCHFESSDQEAIVISPWYAGTYADLNSIIGCDFWSIAQQTNNTYPIIHINCTTGSSRFGTIQGNTMWSTQSNVASIGIYLDGTGADYWSVTGNIIENNAAWISISNSSSHDYIHGNWEGSNGAWD